MHQKGWIIAVETPKNIWIGTWAYTWGTILNKGLNLQNRWYMQKRVLSRWFKIEDKVLVYKCFS